MFTNVSSLVLVILSNNTTTITAIATITSDIRIAFDWITRAMYSHLAVDDWILLVNILHKHTLTSTWKGATMQTEAELDWVHAAKKHEMKKIFYNKLIF